MSPRAVTCAQNPDPNTEQNHNNVAKFKYEMMTMRTG